MGPHQSLQQKIAIYQPPVNQLALIDLGVNFRIYQHRQKLFQVMAHKFTLDTEEDVQKMIENFIARYQHHYLVSTVYLKCDDFSTCGGYVESIVFYQRIFTNLSKIKDIPINDALHFYAVAFKGFQILYQRFGYFQIYEDMFFLTQDSKLKVWCNRDISKNQPQQYLRDKTGKQQDMVRKIIFIIGQNTDQLTDNIQLKQRLIKNGVRNFQMALQSLREICRQFGLSIPERVQCIRGLPSQEVRSVLDQYATNTKAGRKIGNEMDAFGGYMRGSGSNNTLMMGNGRQNYFDSPHFVQPVERKLSQTGQGTSRHLSSRQSRQSTPERITDQIVPTIRPTEKLLSQQQPMIHTFNRYPQVPSHEGRKGIDLSLSVKKDSSPSHLNKTQSVTILSSRNKSQDNSSQKPLLPSPKSNKNEINNTIIKNLQSISRHGLLNTQVHHNQLSPYNNQVKTFYQPHVAIVGQQFLKPTIEARPNYHVSANNNSPQLIRMTPQQHVIHQGVSDHYSKVYISQGQTPNLPMRNPSILKQDSHFIKKGNAIQVNFTKTNSKPVKYPQPNIAVSRPSVVRFEEPSTPIRTPINEKNILTSSIVGRESQFDGSLKRNASTPMLGKKVQKERGKSTNPFEMVEKSQEQNLNFVKINPSQSPNPIPLTSPHPAYLPIHSTSSRYMYSNKQLHDNIPDMKYYKKQSPKKTINKLFDTKVQELQSFNFNESRFGDENSRVLEIIGRDQKDSITSAFGDQQKWDKVDGIKQQQFASYNHHIKLDNGFKNSDSFTDPKILQILKRSSSNALKNEINSLKKGSKGNKMYEFSRQTPMKRPQVDKEVIENPFSYPRYQQTKKQFTNNGQQNFTSIISRNQFQGFPSLSNLSQIKKVEESTPFQQERSNPIFNSANLRQSGKKSKFSEQNLVSRFSSLMKKEQLAGRGELFNKYEFGNGNNDGPTLEYSFSSKKQIPIQDTQWINKYSTTTTGGNKKEETVNSKAAQFKSIAQKPQNFFNVFNSNDSLVSLDIELRNKLKPKHGLDSIQEEESLRKSSNNDQDDEFFRVRVSSAQRETVSSRKYKPSIDPQIGRDLQMFRKQKSQAKNI